MTKVKCTKESKDALFHNCDFNNVDFENEGIGNKAVNSRFNGPTKGVEIYARNIKNSGKISSDTHTKIITENYEGSGEVSSISKKEVDIKWFSTWWGKFIIAVVSTVIAGGLMFLFGWSGQEKLP